MDKLKDRVAISVMKIESGLEKMAVEASKACLRLSNLLGNDAFRRMGRFLESYPEILNDPEAEKAWNELKQYRSKK